MEDSEDTTAKVMKVLQDQSPYTEKGMAAVTRTLMDEESNADDDSASEPEEEE